MFSANNPTIDVFFFNDGPEYGNPVRESCIYPLYNTYVLASYLLINEK